MADSRRASVLHMRRMERVVAGQSRVIAFLLCLLGALLLTYLVRRPEFTTPQVYVLFLLLFSVGLWVTEAVPPFATGIMIIGFLVFSLGRPEIESEYGIDVTAYVNTWSDSVIWLLLGGFFIAQAMTKTGLDVKLFELTIRRFGTSSPRLLLALMLSTAIASMAISNTATTAMVFATLGPLFALTTTLPNLSKALILGIPAAASVGGMGSLIGSPPNAVAADIINNMPDGDLQIGFLEWMYYGAPVALLLVFVLWRAIQWRYPVHSETVDVSLFEDAQPEEDGDAGFTDLKTQRRLVLIVLAVTVFLWITERLHPIPVAATSGIPIIVFTMLGIITSENVRQLPWDTLMLVAGGLSLGLALQHTGLSGYFVEQLRDFHMAPLLIITAFALVTIVLSNVMSNTATVSILVPASVLISAVNPGALSLIIGLSASCALFLPISTPPNAIAFSTGLVEQKDFRLTGTVAGLIGPLLVAIWVLALVGWS